MLAFTIFHQITPFLRNSPGTQTAYLCTILRLYLFSRLGNFAPFLEIWAETMVTWYGGWGFQPHGLTASTKQNGKITTIRPRLWTLKKERRVCNDGSWFRTSSSNVYFRWYTVPVIFAQCGLVRPFGMFIGVFAYGYILILLLGILPGNHYTKFLCSSVKN